MRISVYITPGLTYRRVYIFAVLYSLTTIQEYGKEFNSIELVQCQGSI